MKSNILYVIICYIFVNRQSRVCKLSGLTVAQISSRVNDVDLLSAEKVVNDKNKVLTVET